MTNDFIIYWEGEKKGRKERVRREILLADRICNFVCCAEPGDKILIECVERSKTPPPMTETMEQAKKVDELTRKMLDQKGV